jgi:hypothetical protein
MESEASLGKGSGKTLVSRMKEVVGCGSNGTALA